MDDITAMIIGRMALLDQKLIESCLGKGGTRPAQRASRAAQQAARYGRRRKARR
jgi:hypothetical protein